MPDGSLSVKKGRKFDQVLAGARDVFMSQGFEGAAVDEIARKAGVSKATLYSYFPDKRLLFMEVAKAECFRQAELSLAEVSGDLSIRQILGEIAARFVAFITSDFGQRIFRICVAESDRFPELGQAFYASGPMLMQTHLIEILKAAQARGEVEIEDFKLASDQFVELCKADLHTRMVFSIARTFTQEETQRVAHGAVEMFMARYAKP